MASPQAQTWCKLQPARTASKHDSCENYKKANESIRTALNQSLAGASMGRIRALSSASTHRYLLPPSKTWHLTCNRSERPAPRRAHSRALLRHDNQQKNCPWSMLQATATHTRSFLSCHYATPGAGTSGRFAPWVHSPWVPPWFLPQKPSKWESCTPFLEPWPSAKPRSKTPWKC